MCNNEAFKEFDTDCNGVLDLREVAALLASRNITPMPEVLAAIAKEVGVASTKEFHLHDLRRLMEVLRESLGFTQAEVG